MEYLSENQIRQSFSRVGKQGDNAWSDSFFANLKKEAVHWRHFKTREEAQQAIFAYRVFTTPVGYKKDWTILAPYSG